MSDDIRLSVTTVNAPDALRVSTLRPSTTGASSSRTLGHCPDASGSTSPGRGR